MGYDNSISSVWWFVAIVVGCSNSFVSDSKMEKRRGKFEKEKKMRRKEK